MIWPSQLSCLSSSVHQPECKVSWIQVLPQAVHFSLKMTALGELYCFVGCLLFIFHVYLCNMSISEEIND